MFDKMGTQIANVRTGGSGTAVRTNGKSLHRRVWDHCMNNCTLCDCLSKIIYQGIFIKDYLSKIMIFTLSNALSNRLNYITVCVPCNDWRLLLKFKYLG